jgi:hypothetical protein
MTKEQEKRLMAYYTRLLGGKKLCDNQDETVKRIILTQSDIAFDTLDEKTVSASDIPKTNGRLAAYAKALKSVVKAYENYDYSKEGKIEVNGNTFTYNKERFDPSLYMEDMIRMGESVKGEIFSISLDEDGKVVIY